MVQNHYDMAAVPDPNPYSFPRDFIGYGPDSLDPQWPKGAKIALVFVINYEEVRFQLTSLSN